MTPNEKKNCFHFFNDGWKEIKDHFGVGWSETVKSLNKPERDIETSMLEAIILQAFIK